MIIKFNEFLNEQDDKSKEVIELLDKEISKTTIEMKKKYLENLKKKKQQIDNGNEPG